MVQFVVVALALCLADEMLGTESESDRSVRRISVTTTIKMTDQIPNVQPTPEQESSEPCRAGLARPVQPRWWLGVNCTDIPAPILKHLQIERGLLVGCVAPTSPAEAAGLRPNDILLTFDSQQILDTDDLMGLVEATGGSTVVVELLRDGQRVAAEVTPGLRPQSEPVVLMVDLQGRPFDDQAWTTFERSLGDKTEVGCSIVLVRPGIVIDREFDAVDADATFFPFSESNTSILFAEAGTAFPIEFPQSPWVSRNLRWQNEQIQIGGNQICLFPKSSEHQQVRWIGRTAIGEVEQIEFPGQTRIVAAIDSNGVDGQPLELRIGVELRQWQQRTEELESQVQSLQAEVESLKALIRERATADE